MNTGDSDGCYHAATGAKPAQSSTKPKRAYVKHGLTNAVRSRYRADLNQIDGRSTIARTIQEWRAELVADLGGSEVISAQQAIVIDMILRDRLTIESIESWLAMQPSMVNKRKRALFPIVQQLSALKDGLTRRLALLGLERKPRPAKSLQDILAGPRNEDQTAA